MRYYLFLFLLLTMIGANAQNNQVNRLRARVDKRIELLSTVTRLAGYEEYDNEIFKKYSEDVAQYFGKFRSDTLIAVLRELRKQGFGFDLVMQFAISMDDNLHLRTSPLSTDSILLKQLGWERIVQVHSLLLSFANISNFKLFFERHAAFYEECVRRFQPVLDQVDVSWYRTYYGNGQIASFNVVLGLLNAGANYGPHINIAGSDELYSIVGTWNIDPSGLPDYLGVSAPIVNNIIHEFNHSFINPVVYRNIPAFSNCAEIVFPYVRDKLSAIAYNNAITMMLESIVRVSVSRYLFDHYPDSSLYLKDIIRNRNLGFLWMPDLFTAMGIYANNRNQFVNFTDFFPSIVGFYCEIASRIKYITGDFNRRTPKVISIAPDIRTLDSSIHEISFSVRPNLNPGASYSIDFGKSGRSFFPKIKKVLISPDGSVITLSVDLQPQHAYDFTLTGKAFLSSDSYPLEPFNIQFTTR